MKYGFGGMRNLRNRLTRFFFCLGEYSFHLKISWMLGLDVFFWDKFGVGKTTGPARGLLAGWQVESLNLAPKR